MSKDWKAQSDSYGRKDHPGEGRVNPEVLKEYCAVCSRKSREASIAGKRQQE